MTEETKTAPWVGPLHGWTRIPSYVDGIRKLLEAGVEVCTTFDDSRDDAYRYPVKLDGEAIVVAEDHDVYAGFTPYTEEHVYARGGADLAAKVWIEHNTTETLVMFRGAMIDPPAPAGARWVTAFLKTAACDSPLEVLESAALFGDDIRIRPYDSQIRVAMLVDDAVAEAFR